MSPSFYILRSSEKYKNGTSRAPSPTKSRTACISPTVGCISSMRKHCISSQIINSVRWTLRACRTRRKRKNRGVTSVFPYIMNQVYKPCSVFDGHLSLPYVTVKLRNKLRATHRDGLRLIEQIKSPYAVLLQVGFTPILCYHRISWALTSRFHPYPCGR